MEYYVEMLDRCGIFPEPEQKTDEENHSKILTAITAGLAIAGLLFIALFVR